MRDSDGSATCGTFYLYMELKGMLPERKCRGSSMTVIGWARALSCDKKAKTGNTFSHSRDTAAVDIIEKKSLDRRRYMHAI